MKQRTYLAAAALAGLCVLGGAAWASGSDGGGGAETGDFGAYNTGKLVYSSKLACSTCPLAGKTINRALATELLASKPAEAKLSEDESHALDVYLKRRFRL